MGELRVLNSQGDITVTWDPADSESCEKAKKEWDRLKADGYEFFEPVETKSKRVTRFSKKLGKVIAAPGAKTTVDKEQGTRPKAMGGGPLEQVATMSR